MTSKPRVAINGFGRMGRLALRDALAQSDYDVVLVNDRAGDADAAAHLFQFDSIHGAFPGAVQADAGPTGVQRLTIDGVEVEYTSSERLEDGKWQGLDVVVDCTGAYRTSTRLAPYFSAGVKKVVVSAPVKDGPLNIVYGVNDHLYDPAKDHLVTAASCTTNCIAPLISVLLTQFGIKRGAFTTIHALTNTQRVLDGFHRDLRRARSSATSLIPTTTGSATAIFEIFPELRGRLDGVAVRVPVAQASIADCTFELNADVTAEDINHAIDEAANSHLQGILGLEQRPLVSIDYEGERRSAVVDALSTQVIDGSLAKLLVWYDNETGYVARMMDLVARVARDL